MSTYVSTNTIKKYKLNQRNTTSDQSVSEGLEVFGDPMLEDCGEETSPCEESLLLSRDLYSPVPQSRFCPLAPFPFCFFPLCVLETLSIPKTRSLLRCSTKPSQIMFLSRHVLCLSAVQASTTPSPCAFYVHPHGLGQEPRPLPR